MGGDNYLKIEILDDPAVAGRVTERRCGVPDGLPVN